MWFALLVGGAWSEANPGDEIEECNRICLSVASLVNTCDDAERYSLVVGVHEAARGGPGAGGESESIEGISQICDSQKKS